MTERSNGKRRGGIFRRVSSPFYWADYVDATGRRRRRSTGRRTRREAEQIRAKWIGEKPKPATDPAFEELVADLRADYDAQDQRSWRRVEQALVHLEPVFGTRTASRITAPGIREYRNARRNAGAAKSTVAYELALLQRMLNLAKRNEKLDAIPTFPQLRVSNARDEYITEGEFAGLMVELPNYLRGFIAFRYYTGWRDSETLRLHWDQVDWKNGEVFIERGVASKNYEPRRFPFHNYPELRSVLEHQLTDREACERCTGREIALVFHRDGQPIKSFRRAWVGACKRVGAVGRDGRLKRPHDLCRSAARRMEQAGIPRSVAKQLFGRRTESIFTRYAVVDAGRDLAAGTERLAALTLRHTEGTLEDSDHKDGVPAEARTPCESSTYDG